MESMRQLINSNNLCDLRRNKRKKIKINVVKGSHMNKKKLFLVAIHKKMSYQRSQKRSQL